MNEVVVKRGINIKIWILIYIFSQTLEHENTQMVWWLVMHMLR